MKIAFHNIGCKVNYAELSRIREDFELRGYEIAGPGETADIVVVQTCTVTNRADADSRKIIRRAVRENPDAKVIVTGCYAQMRPDEIAQLPGVIAVAGMDEKYSIAELLPEYLSADAVRIDRGEGPDFGFYPASSAEEDARSRAFFKLQDGCDYSCTYCAVHIARGRSRSMNFDEIAAGIERLENAGFREVILSGINLGEYKAPTGENFAEVLDLIEDMPASMRFRISSVEPNLLSDEIIRRVARSQKICPHLHLPLQSGSNEILAKMRRRYRAELFADRVDSIKTTMPDAAIGVDVITGFPGESEENFRETYDLLKSLPISYLHVFTYSERKGTPAASMKPVIPGDIRKARTKELTQLSDFKKREFYKSQAGKELRVLPERIDSKSGLWVGWTENYVRAAFAYDGVPEGIIPVIITEPGDEYCIAKAIDQSNKSIK